MTKRLQQDISQSRYEKKKILKHENVEEICEENKCKEMKIKVKSVEEPIEKS
jgi:hypothetical protein